MEGLKDVNAGRFDLSLQQQSRGIERLPYC